jgi:hypothetical protein
MLPRTRGHDPQRLLDQPRRIQLLQPLHLPSLSAEQSALDCLPIEVITGELELQHHLELAWRWSQTWWSPSTRRTTSTCPWWRCRRPELAAVAVLVADRGRDDVGRHHRAGGRGGR